MDWKTLYHTANGQPLSSPSLPLIGIDRSDNNWNKALLEAGSCPFVPCISAGNVETWMNSIDGFLVTSHLDATGMFALRMALDWQLPVLAVNEGVDSLRESCRDLLTESPSGELSLPFKSVRGCFCQKDTINSWAQWLADESREFRKARLLHQHIVSLDTHCDTPMFFHRDIRFSERCPEILVDSHKMHQGHIDACIMVAYLEQQARDEQSLQQATLKAQQLLDGIDQRIGSCQGVGIAYTPDDICELKLQGRLAIMKGIENGYAIGKDLSNIEHFRQQGVVYMTLCHNGDNDICDSASKTRHEHGGLSDFGHEVIREMNRTGMMVDLSHAGENSFFDALHASTTPIVCSHSSSRALCDHPRNLTDEQMKALAQVGGVMQVTLYPGFLRTDGKATIEDAVAHLIHAADIAGVEHVGIGTDFDGDGGIPGIADASEAINFTRQLLRHHFSEKDIQLIWGGNFLRVMQLVQDAATIPFLHP